jgi:hypothetical protein
MIAGDQSMPNPAGGTMIGKSGNGYVKITFLSPIGTITYSPDTKTNQDVIATLTLNMSGNILSGNDWIATGTDGKQFTKLYTGNITNEEVIFQEEKGFTGSAFITIDRIDKNLPKVVSPYVPDVYNG